MEENNQNSTPVDGEDRKPNESTGETQEVKSEPSNNPENTPNYPIEEGGEAPKTSGALKARSILRTLVLVVIIVAVVWFFNLDGKDNKNKGEILGDNENGTSQEQPNDNNQDGVSQDNGVADDSSDAVIENNADLVDITAYYAKGGKCNEVFALTRKIKKKYKQDIVNTIRGLLTPLTEAEKAQGFTSNIPVGTYLTSVFVDGNGQALIKLNKKLSEAGEECAVTSAQAQIEQTLLQFPYVKSVVIK